MGFSMLLSNYGGVLGGFNHPHVKALNINRTVFLGLTKDVQTQKQMAHTSRLLMEMCNVCILFSQIIRNMPKKAKHLHSEGNI